MSSYRHHRAWQWVDYGNIASGVYVSDRSIVADAQGNMCTSFPNAETLAARAPTAVDWRALVCSWECDDGGIALRGTDTSNYVLQALRDDSYASGSTFNTDTYEKVAGGFNSRGNDNITTPRNARSVYDVWLRGARIQVDKNGERHALTNLTSLQTQRGTIGVRSGNTNTAKFDYFRATVLDRATNQQQPVTLWRRRAWR